MDSTPHSAAHATPAPGAVSRLFGQVAFWQTMGFLALVCLVWAKETLDLPSLLFGEPPSPVDWIGASLLSAGVLAVALIVVGHTYLQQQRVLKGFISVCSYCHKVHVEETGWEQMEEYISDRTLAEFTHGICPTCYGRLVEELEADGTLPPGHRDRGTPPPPAERT